MADRSFIDQVTGESTNLELHTDLCARRYQQLMDRLDHMDQHMDAMQNMIRDIHESITQLKTRTLKNYLTWAGVIITALISFTAGLVLHIITG